MAITILIAPEDADHHALGDDTPDIAIAADGAHHADLAGALMLMLIVPIAQPADDCNQARHHQHEVDEDIGWAWFDKFAQLRERIS